MTSINYAHLQVIVTITINFHRIPLKTERGVADTNLCLRTDEPITIAPLINVWDNNKLECFKNNPLSDAQDIVETRTSVDKMAKTDKGP